MNETSKWKTKLNKKSIIQLRVQELVLRGVRHWSYFVTAATSSLLVEVTKCTDMYHIISK